VLGPLAALGTTIWFSTLLGRTPFFLFFVVGGLLSLWFGLASALFAVGLSAVLSLVFMQPQIDWIQVLVYLLINVPLVIFIDHDRRAVRTLRESQQRYQRLADLSNDIILEDDLDGRITAINSAAAKIGGYPLDQIIGRRIDDFVLPEYHAQILASRQTLRSGRPTSAFDLRFRAANGREICLDVRAAVRYEHGIPVGYLGVARDISDRLRLEAQFRQAQKMEAIGRLTGGIAHDFGNMLTAIMGYADTVLSSLGPDHPRAGDLRQQIAVCERGAALIRQLLAYSRRQELKPVVLDLNESVREVSPMLQTLLSRAVRLETRLASDIGRVRMDPNQLVQVLMNLAVNARDAMPDGGTFTIETGHLDVPPDHWRGTALIQAGPYVTLSVADTGVGMDAATQARVFEPFFTTKPEGVGTGLGLATTYGIVKQSGGYIWVESEVGQGTKFEIQLPRVETTANGGPNGSATS
jgi:PAS domain S-box-containing protein